MNTLATVMYRNPIEEWWWESGVGFWAILVLAAIVIVALIVLACGPVTDWLWGKFFKRK